MKNPMLSLLVIVLGILSVIALGAYLTPGPRVMHVHVIQESHSPEFLKAFFDASKVYGKAGCGDQQLAEMTARRALVTGLPAAVIAAGVAVESTCNELAISNRGAVGLTQIVPKVWSKQYDFSKVNLFDREQNMTVGTDIQSKLVKQYGLHEGLRHYYGTGVDNLGLGGLGYADKILALAGKL